MPTYEEFCPRGLTSEITRFSIEDDRQPAPTNPCICRGDAHEKNLIKIAGLIRASDVTAGFLAVMNSIGQGGKPVEYQIHKISANPGPIVGVHSTAIRKIG